MIVSKRAIVGSKIWSCCKCRLASTNINLSGKERHASQKLPATPARTRFAPSPTGYLHLGSLRTALFNYLTAKATGGQFILRVEDTDRKRTVEDAENRLYRDLKWAGLQWDEGPDIGGQYGPYKQSERTPLYREHAQRLLDSGHAYRCFCSAERLNSLARERNEQGLPSDYDRTCASISRAEADERSAKGELNVVRLKVPDVPPIYHDLVYGIVGQQKKTTRPKSICARPGYEDPILLKSDGLPTYHLANVVDDHCMKVSHVIRAVEWMPSTPKHMVIYNAFNWEPPKFAHVGLLQDTSRQKLSKRDLSLDIRELEKDGIFSEALVNYVALFGWSHRLGDDFINLHDLVKNFDLKFTKGNTVASPKKLFYLQNRYAQKYVVEGGKEYESMIDKLHNIAEQHFRGWPGLQICPDNELRARIVAVLHADALNYTTPKQFFERNAHFFCSRPREEWRPLSNELQLKDAIGIFNSHFEDVPPEKWDKEHLQGVFSCMADDISAKLDCDRNLQSVQCKSSVRSLQHFLRWALSGGRPGPTLILTMAILGRDLSFKRIRDAVASLTAVSTEVENFSG